MMTVASPETRAYQRAQVALRAVVYSDVSALWRLLQYDALDRSFPLFAAAAISLIESRRVKSADLARAYLRARRHGVKGSAPEVTTPQLDRAAALVSLRVTTAIGIKSATAIGTDRELALRNALVRTMGVADKYVGDAGRELIRQSVEADPSAKGWVRRTLGTCDYCAGQAEGAHLQAGSADFPRHDHCGCQPEPVYGGAHNAAASDWATLSREEILARGDGTPLATKALSKVKSAYQLGRHAVTLEVDLPPERTAALLEDIQDVLSKAGSSLDGQSVTFHVPLGDRHFGGSTNLTGGYVTQGQSTVYLNPMTVNGGAEDALAHTTLSGHFMPAVDRVGFRKYTITHELGHVIDHAHTHTMPHVHDHNGRLITSRISPDAKALAKDARAGLSKYGRSNVTESYAEAFAQWALGGPGSSPVADAYAKRYGWN